MRIAPKIRLFAICLVVASSLMIAVALYLGFDTVIARLQVENMESHAAMEVKRVTFAFAEVTHDVGLLAGLPVLKDITGSERGSERLAAAKDHLAEVFAQMLSVKPHYRRLRLIALGDSRREVVNLESFGGVVSRVPEEQLREQGALHGFVAASQMPPGVPHYSGIILEDEGSVASGTYRPALRMSTTVMDSSGAVFGIVVIDLNFRRFFDELLADEAARYRYYLTDEAGRFLYHPDPSHAFGSDVGLDNRAQLEFPGLEPFYQTEAAETTLRFSAMSASASRLLHFRKLRPFPEGRWLALGVAASYEDVGEASTYIGFGAILLLAILIAAGTMVAFVLSLKLTRPIERVASAAKRLAEGGPDMVLPSTRDDEIGDLAKSFLQMRRAITRNEAEIMSINERLGEASRDLAHFSHISSHEMREPIRRIAGLANLLEIEGKDSKSAEESGLLKSLQAECVRALRQITDFRIFANIGEGVMYREEVDVRATVHTVLGEFSEELNERRVAIRLDELPRLNAYPNLLFVLYRNLVENALMHSKLRDFELAFTAEEVDGESVLGVRNTGSVLEERKRAAAFDLFTRFERSREGSGTGLAVCKRVVNRHAGKIWIESGEDHVHIKFTLGTESNASGGS